MKLGCLDITVLFILFRPATCWEGILDIWTDFVFLNLLYEPVYCVDGLVSDYLLPLWVVGLFLSFSVVKSWTNDFLLILCFLLSPSAKTFCYLKYSFNLLNVLPLHTTVFWDYFLAILLFLLSFLLDELAERSLFMESLSFLKGINPSFWVFFLWLAGEEG